MATQCGAIDDLVLVRDFRLSLLVVICDKTDRKRFPKPGKPHRRRWNRQVTGWTWQWWGSIGPGG